MRANRSGRLLPRMPGTSKTINRLRWPVELRGLLLSRWWLKLQAPGTQALQPSSSMRRGLWRQEPQYRDWHSQNHSQYITLAQVL